MIGLYLNPPHNALVLSIDEKPPIQAIERTCGYVHTSSGKIVRAMKSTCKRHGTLNLFAALQVATGEIQGKITAAYNKNAAPFIWRKRKVKGAQLRNTIINLCN